MVHNTPQIDKLVIRLDTWWMKREPVLRGYFQLKTNWLNLLCEAVVMQKGVVNYSGTISILQYYNKICAKTDFD